MRQPYKRKSICHTEPKENPRSCPAYNPFAYLRASVRPSLRPSASLPLRPQLPAGHRANSAIFFLCAPLSYKKMLQCAANVCLYNGSVHKKGARSKNYKTRSRGQGRMHNNSSSSNHTGWDCSDIAGSAQHKRKNRKTFTTYKTLFTHRHKPTVCSWVCVWSCIFLCIHIWLLRARVRNFFCGNFSFSCCTLSFCCSVVASYPTLADCTTETDGTDTRTQRTLRHTHTHTHGQADRSDTAQDLY